VNVAKGQLVILVYFSIYYLFPFAYGAIFGFDHLGFLNGSPNFYLGIMFVLLYCGAAFMVFKLPSVRLWSNRLTYNFYNEKLTNLFISVIFLFFAVKFFSDYGYQYRHKGSSISDSAGYIIILQVLKLYFNCFIVIKMAMYGNKVNLKLIDRVVLIVIFFAFLFSFATSFDIFRLAVILYLAISRKNLSGLFSLERFSFRKNIVLAIVIMGLVFGVLFMGVANKRGPDEAINFFFSENIFSLLDYFVARLSIFFYSVSYYVTYHEIGSTMSIEVFKGIIENANYRLGHILGYFAEKPEIQSTNRMNSMNIYVHVREDNGAAPGLIGSVFFIPFYPGSILLSVLFLKMLVNFINEIFRNTPRLSFLSIIYLITVISTIMDSTLDLLNIFGLGFIQLFFLLWAWLTMKNFNHSILVKNR